MKTKLYYLLLAAGLTACGSPGPESGADYVRWVDPRIGTGDHGHVFLGANVPFGMVQLGPTSIPETWDWCSGYNHADTTVIGFGHTHLSGTGIGDLNDVSLLPVVGEVTFGRGESDDPASGQWSYFRRADEACEPGYYRTRLDRYGVDVELTATCRVGLSRYEFPETDDAAVILDLENGQGWDEPVDCGVHILDSVMVEGWRRSTGWAKDQYVYFHLRLSRPFCGVTFAGDSLSEGVGEVRGRTLYARFGYDATEGEPLLVKVALSGVSMAGARQNMEAECPGWDFEAVRRDARAAWNRELSKVAIETRDESVRRIFYTALYHMMIAPSVFSDVDGSYRGADGAIHTDPGHTTYTTFSLWDTYRAVHPLLTLTQPERVPDLIRTMLAIDREQDKLPVWHLWGNEPSHHVAYFYTLTGQPWKTADRVRQILTTLYHDRPDGICGNEDAGQMSAWYALSALGMYQVEPAGGRYVFGSPLVDRAVLRVPGGEFVIEARNNSADNRYIRRITLNGADYRKPYIEYGDIMSGGHLVFEMTAKLTDWTLE